MNDNQKYTPKYWVLHDYRTDDVYLQTASKSKGECFTFSDAMLGKEWEDCESLEVILVEVRMVKL